MEGFLADELLQSPVALCQPQSISRSASPCNKLWLGNCGYRHATNNYQRYQESITLIPHVVCLHLSALNNSRLAKNTHTHTHGTRIRVACEAWVRARKSSKHVYYCIYSLETIMQWYSLLFLHEHMQCSVFFVCVRRQDWEGKCLSEYSPPGCFDRWFIPQRSKPCQLLVLTLRGANLDEWWWDCSLYISRTRLWN